MKEAYSIVDRISRLWGKTEKENPSPQNFHPAVFHMLDLGNVARELLGEMFSLAH